MIRIQSWRGRAFIACLAAAVSFGFPLPTHLFAATAQESSLTLYAAPAGMPLNDTFTVEARSPGTDWRKLDVYDVRVDLHTLSHASFAYFDFGGKVEVRVTYNKGAVQKAEIRPVSCQVHPVMEGQTVLTFVLDRPRNLSIEVNGDRLHNLHLFANGLELNPPSPSDPNVIYFGPGIHTDRQITRVGSGKTVYLAGGSVVQGILITEDGATNVTIRGRGIMDMTPWNEAKGRYIHGQTWQAAAVNLRWTTNALLEGFIIKQNTDYAVMGGAADHVTIDNIKTFSSHEWSDGIDMMSSHHIRIKNCFLRTSDDCITVYASRRDCRGGAADWEVTNCALWADNAHAIFVGMHGAFWADGDVIEDLHFRNIDILENREYIPKYYGALGITCGDKNTVRNVTYEDIRVEHISEGSGHLIQMGFDFYEPSTTPGRRIENITFKNISYTGNEGSLIEGNRGGVIEGITIDNLVINGQRVKNAKEGKFTIGENVTGVVFVP